MKKMHFSLGRHLLKIEISAQDTTISRIQPLNHELRLARIEEERRSLMARY